MRVLDWQLRRFEPQMEDELVERLMRRELALFPDRCGGMGDEALRYLVRRAFAQARAHGLVSERDVGSYVDLTVLFGVGFDEPPAIAAIFTTPDRLAVERVDAVYELLGDPPEPPPANAR
ncbi:MAG: hypothetical protein KC731_20070 [Myxococcales bacterium]|nr:hypothetical protein [Myxococcales bacterium]